MRALLVLVAIIAVGCGKPTSREIDRNLIRVTNDARLRTDTIGDGKWAEQSTFVLVEAENTSKEGAYVTLAGDLVDPDGATVGTLKPQSLFVPAGELRTFALVDIERRPKPTAKGARLFVRGAKIMTAPPARVDGVKQITDGDKIVMQGVLKNEAKRGGELMVIATFYAPDGRPMTRPFTVLWVAPNGELPVQFVGPPGSTRGTLFIGDAVY